MRRRAAVDRLYRLLERLEGRLGGRRPLASATGGDGWPERGVYFLFEPGERRSEADEPRVVRVGTDGLGEGAGRLEDRSGSTLGERLRQHSGTRGTDTAAGDHRASVLRMHVGTALLERDDDHGDLSALWVADSPTAEVRERERGLEQAVSRHIGSMRVLWLPAGGDDPATAGERGVIARNAIALLSNAGSTDPVDLASQDWLGRHARSLAVRWSGLWNVEHVEDAWEAGFLDVLERHVGAL